MNKNVYYRKLLKNTCFIPRIETLARIIVLLIRCRIEVALILVKFWFNLRFNINPSIWGIWLTGD